MLNFWTVPPMLIHELKLCQNAESNENWGCVKIRYLPLCRDNACVVRNTWNCRLYCYSGYYLEADMARHVPTLTSNIKHLYFDTPCARTTKCSGRLQNTSWAKLSVWCRRHCNSTQHCGGGVWLRWISWQSMPFNKFYVFILPPARSFSINGLHLSITRASSVLHSVCTIGLS